jgi:hypothetical protein
MSKHVFRTDLRQRPVGEPLPCTDGLEIFFRPNMPTVEQCVQSLLIGDEICLGTSSNRTVMQGPRVVGYVRIVDACAWVPQGGAA